MRITVVYESMFGNTHEVAERIAATLDDLGDVRVLPTKLVTREDVADIELLIVGGPTHTHGLSSKHSRKAAVETAEEDPTVDLDDEFGGPGLRNWIGNLPNGLGRFCVAFDTRADKPEVLSGSAARGIARRLRHHGYKELVEHESFVLDGNGPIDETELDRATEWGRSISKRCKALNLV